MKNLNNINKIPDVSFSCLKEMYINMENRHNVLQVLNNIESLDYYVKDLIFDCELTDNILDNSVSHKAILELNNRREYLVKT